MLCDAASCGPEQRIPAFIWWRQEKDVLDFASARRGKRVRTEVLAMVASTKTAKKSLILITLKPPFQVTCQFGSLVNDQTNAQHSSMHSM